MTSSLPPGWYPSQSEPGVEAFWDGQHWTEGSSNSAEVAAARPAESPPAKRHLEAKQAIAGTVAVLIVVGVAITLQQYLSHSGEPAIAVKDQSASAACEDLVDEVMGIKGVPMLKVRSPRVEEDHRSD